MKHPWMGVLALAGQCALLGCHKADLTPEQAVAAEQTTLNNEQESAGASIIYAQQELALAKVHASPAQDAGEPNGDPLKRAEVHMQAAEMNAKLTEDRLQSLRDYRNYQHFLKTAFPQ